MAISISSENLDTIHGQCDRLRTSKEALAEFLDSSNSYSDIKEVTNADTLDILVDKVRNSNYIVKGAAEDADLKSENIKEGHTILGVEGSYEDIDDSKKELINYLQNEDVNNPLPYTDIKDITDDMHFSDLVTQIESANYIIKTPSEISNLKPEFIKGNINILGIIGSYENIDDSKKKLIDYLQNDDNNSSFYTNITNIEDDMSFEDLVTQIKNADYIIKDSSKILNLNSSVIKQGTSILGIEGTYENIDSPKATLIKYLQNSGIYTDIESITDSMSFSSLATQIENANYIIKTPSEIPNLKSSNIVEGENILGIIGTRKVTGSSLGFNEDLSYESLTINEDDIEES